MKFIEVFVDTDITTCESRDPKGLYKKAKAGEINNFTGISAPYELPESPEIHLLNNDNNSAEANVKIVMEYLKRNGIIPDVIG